MMFREYLKACQRFRWILAISFIFFSVMIWGYACFVQAKSEYAVTIYPPYFKGSINKPEPSFWLFKRDIYHDFKKGHFRRVSFFDVSERRPKWLVKFQVIFSLSKKGLQAEFERYLLLYFQGKLRDLQKENQIINQFINNSVLKKSVLVREAKLESQEYKKLIKTYTVQVKFIPGLNIYEKLALSCLLGALLSIFLLILCTKVFEGEYDEK